MNSDNSLYRWFWATTLTALISMPHLAMAAFVPNEVLVSDASMQNAGIIDPEFDQTTARFCWVDNQGRVWVGKVDRKTGLFTPPDGRYEAIDVNGVTVPEIGNGPEWVYTDHGPEITYAKKQLGTWVLKRAIKNSSGWVTSVVEGSYGASPAIGSLDQGDPNPRLAYVKRLNPWDPGQNLAVYTRFLGDPASESMVPLSDEYFTPGARWIPGSHGIIYSRATDATDPNLKRQVFRYDIGNPEPKQLTFDPGRKKGTLMWEAPEYGREKIFLTLVNERRVDIYRFLDEDNNGVYEWTVINSIDPPSDWDWLWSPEPFVYQGKSYIVMQVTPAKDQASYDFPTEIWIAGIDPANPFYRKISDDLPVNRKDPEIFITENGPYAYILRAKPGGMSPMIYRLDTGLGPQAN